MNLFKYLVLLSVLGILLCLNAQSYEIIGKVVRIADGDTITLRSAAGNDHKIRLEGIDSPESSQDFGRRAASALRSRISAKTIRAKVTTRDRYGRYIATLFLDGEDVNAWMVAQGWAWHYKQYSKDQRLAELEQRARTENLGLWVNASALAPWDFRLLKRQTRAVKAGDAIPIGYWLNTSSNTRHNSTCKWYNKTKRGKICNKFEGKACGSCGG